MQLRNCAIQGRIAEHRCEMTAPAPKSKKYHDFNGLVRSEGGEDASNFNNLQRWVNGLVHFPSKGAFQAEHQS